MPPTISTTGNLPALPPSSVLVCYNANVADSAALANYYMAARGIPSGNKLALNLTSQPSAIRTALTLADYTANVQTPIYAKITALGGLYSSTNTGGVLFVAFCPFVGPAVCTDTRGPGGTPLPNTAANRSQYYLHSVGGLLRGNYPGSTLPSYGVRLPPQPNVFHARFGYGLTLDPWPIPVQRPDYDAPFSAHLDCFPADGEGYTLQKVKTLVDLSLAARPWKARWLLQPPNGGYLDGYQALTGAYTAELGRSRDLLQNQYGIHNVIYSVGRTYSQARNLMGVVWAGVYSTDIFAFGPEGVGTPRMLLNHFLPGSICGQCNSWGGIRYSYPPSNVADFQYFTRIKDSDANQWATGATSFYHCAPDDLLQNSMTGGYCTVTEAGGDINTSPCSDAMIYMYQFLGYTLAETLTLSTTGNGRELITGDPLCAPYAAS